MDKTDGSLSAKASFVPHQLSTVTESFDECPFSIFLCIEIALVKWSGEDLQVSVKTGKRRGTIIIENSITCNRFLINHVTLQIY